MNFSKTSTVDLYNYLQILVNTENLICKSYVPGIEYTNVALSIKFIREIHTVMFDEFKTREDAKKYYPEIVKFLPKEEEEPKEEEPKEKTSKEKKPKEED